MNKIFVIREEEEVITARDTMNNAIAACVNRMVICGYTCESIDCYEHVTLIAYRDHTANETRTMIIEEVSYREGV